MAIKRNTQIQTMFNMSSLTDIIFLLLIFFMLTSSFVVQNALDLQLPKATNKEIVNNRIDISITSEPAFRVNNEPVAEANLQAAVRKAIEQLEGGKAPVIAISADKQVAIDHIVTIMRIGKTLNARVALMTDPE